MHADKLNPTVCSHYR